MRVLGVAAADLVLGATCAGCDRPAVTWCRACAAAARPDPRVVEPPEVHEVRVVAAAENVGTVSRLLVGWKERGRFGLLAPFGASLAAAVQVAAPDGDLVLVPVPTDRSNVRARGGDLVADLAGVAARELRRVGREARSARSLVRTRRTRDQSGLDAAARRANVDGAFASRRVPEGTLVVVDDIVTTGATVTEAVRALEVRGRRVAAIAVVAATPGPRSR